MSNIALHRATAADYTSSSDSSQLVSPPSVASSASDSTVNPGLLPLPPPPPPPPTVSQPLAANLYPDPQFLDQSYDRKAIMSASDNNNGKSVPFISQICSNSIEENFLSANQN
ncbi:hypothetical protein Aperf_G00000067458 [Anoplocephala perfoliata]